MKKHCVAKVLLAIWETFSHENNHNYNSNRYFSTNSLLSSFCHFLQNKNKNQVFRKSVVCFLFIVSRALLESHAKFNILLQRNFLTRYYCSYYGFMVWGSIHKNKLRPLFYRRRKHAVHVIHFKYESYHAKLSWRNESCANLWDQKLPNIHLYV